jgi:glycerate-2-kinase
MSGLIKNTASLGTTPARTDALAIAESAYAAIDTGAVVRAQLWFDGATLHADGRAYELSKYKRIHVFGFGKASCRAVEEIGKVLDGRVERGVAIDVRPGVCAVADVWEGTHPKPSAGNVAVTERIVGMAENCEEDDLVIVAVSGGGSALLCWPMDECDQGVKLYDDFLHTGATIEEMNTVRKHISAVKGGGLAKLLYPATVVALVFCDVPGEHYEEVASGPTYLDKSSVADAQAILDKYGLTGYALHETPKEAMYFEKVHNIPAISNHGALDAMQREAESRGYRVVRIGEALYDEPAKLLSMMREASGHKTVVLAGGEPRLIVTKKGGKGGRCQYVSLEALRALRAGETMLAFGSDGKDNSDAAGALTDAGTLARAAQLSLRFEDALDSFDTYTFLQHTNDLIMTGPTDANVSDLFALIHE